MAQRRKVVGIRKEDLVTCPHCKGLGQVVHSRWTGKKGIATCTTCHGSGIFCLVLCRCGRPLRFDEKGKVEKNIFCCGDTSCKTALKPSVKDAEDSVYQPGPYQNWLGED